MKRNMVPRKLGAAVLILTLCLSLMVTGAWAAEPSLEGNWTDNGNYDISWYNDTDSEFTLSDAADLAGLAVLVNGGNTFAGKTVTLANDIDLNGHAWTPIGDGSTNSSYFSGTFDGQTHAVTGMNISVSDAQEYPLVGFFGDADHEVKNLSLEGNIEIEVTNGGVYGPAVGGLMGTSGGTVNNCIIDVNINTHSNGVNYWYFGGIAGQVYAGQMKNCIFNGEMAITCEYPYSAYFGGIAGYCTNATISSCKFGGSISVKNAGGYVGGIVGQTDYWDGNYSIESCYSAGSISVLGSFSTPQNGIVNAINCGGIAGTMTANSADCRIVNSFSTSTMNLSSLSRFNCSYMNPVLARTTQSGGTVSGLYYAEDPVFPETGTKVEEGSASGVTDPYVVLDYGQKMSLEEMENEAFLEQMGDCWAVLSGEIIHVMELPSVETVTLNSSTLNLSPEETAQLIATVVPADVYEVTWTSSDPSVATVDANGLVTAVAPGTATITATADGVSATCTVTVTRPYTPPANPNYRIDITDTANGTVITDPTSTKAGTTVTLTPVPDEGYVLGSLAVTDRFGDPVALTEQADGTYTFTMPNGQVTVSATFVEVEEPAAEPFTDVDESDWFYEDVAYVYENGLMNGVGEGLFGPEATTTRAMVVTILYRLEGEPTVTGDTPFTDLVAGQYYLDAVAWASTNDIVNGVTSTTFAPNDPITREQMAAILYRYAQYKGMDTTDRGNLGSFADGNTVSPYAVEALAWANAEGLINGVENNRLNPTGQAPRSQVAAILHRFCTME